MADTRAEKLKVFISYSRKDSAQFADLLVEGLKNLGYEPFLDRHDIAPGEGWKARLSKLIEQADTVVFVVSPEAIQSEMCQWEVDRTLALSKRLLPVVHKKVPNETIPPRLTDLQFIGFDEVANVMVPLGKLANALRVDFDWIREHTRLGDLAERWQKYERSDSLLLRGAEIEHAKKWQDSRNPDAPEISGNQAAFIRASVSSAQPERGSLWRLVFSPWKHITPDEAKSMVRIGTLGFVVVSVICGSSAIFFLQYGVTTITWPPVWQLVNTAPVWQLANALTPGVTRPVQMWSFISLGLALMFAACAVSTHFKKSRGAACAGSGVLLLALLLQLPDVLWWDLSGDVILLVENAAALAGVRGTFAIAQLERQARDYSG